MSLAQSFVCEPEDPAGSVCVQQSAPGTRRGRSASSLQERGLPDVRDVGRSIPGLWRRRCRCRLSEAECASGGGAAAHCRVSRRG